MQKSSPASTMTMASKAISALALTAGEPAGIGLDIMTALAKPQGQQPASPAQPDETLAPNQVTRLTPHTTKLVYVGDPELLIARADHLSRALTLIPFDCEPSIQGTNKAPSSSAASSTRGQARIYKSQVAACLPEEKAAQAQLYYHPVRCNGQTTPGQLNPETSRYVLETLETAVQLCEAGSAQAIVTGPVHKGIINDAGIAFSGHTDWLKTRTQAENVVMLLANNQLRVALTTTHIPLSEVSQTLTAERIERTLRTLHWEMRRLYRLDKPRIAVCGLNPHAGEGGHLGLEEQQIIEPCLDKLRQEGFDLLGPLPADTAFLPHLRAQYDVCLTHYHDQGLPVLKALDFEGAINVSLGLPIIRTSVDHGTALPLAGSGTASATSFEQAVQAAAFFAASQKQSRETETNENKS